MKTKISVITPIYNGSQYIEQCLMSIKSQTVFGKVDFEAILIDDASTDGLQDKIDELKSKIGLDIIYLRNEINLGPAESRNRGIKEAKGDYIAYLDADDWWEDSKIEKQLKLIKEKNAQFTYTSRKNLYEDGREKVLTCLEEVDFNEILKNNHITCSSVLMSSKVAKANLMTHPELGEDYVNWLQILLKIPNAYGVNEPLVNYRVHKGSLSSNKVKQLEKRWVIMKLFEIPFNKRVIYIYSYIVTGIAKYK